MKKLISKLSDILYITRKKNCSALDIQGLSHCKAVEKKQPHSDIN